jgi:hypothetical protein
MRHICIAQANLQSNITGRAPSSEISNEPLAGLATTYAVSASRSVCRNRFWSQNSNRCTRHILAVRRFLEEPYPEQHRKAHVHNSQGDGCCEQADRK